MEYCPRCKKMTAQRDLYTKEVICYNSNCYEGVKPTKHALNLEKTPRKRPISKTNCRRKSLKP
jgi:hypothetical protein